MCWSSTVRPRRRGRLVCMFIGGVVVPSDNSSGASTFAPHTLSPETAQAQALRRLPQTVLILASNSNTRTDSPSTIHLAVSTHASYGLKSVRVTHYYDAVPHVPEELLGYLHVPGMHACSATLQFLQNRQYHELWK